MMEFGAERGGLVTTELKMGTRFSPDMVRQATLADMDQCYALEQSVREDRPMAEGQGFLLSGGDPRERYDEFQGYGAFHVIDVGDRVAAFVFALPPDSPRMQQLLGVKHKFQMTEDGIFERPNLAWLAKVAVQPELMRQGVARALYTHLFASHPDWNFLTTTVFEPLRNLPSELLHESFGFRQVGLLPMGDRGTLKGVVCKVHFRPTAD